MTQIDKEMTEISPICNEICQNRNYIGLKDVNI